MNRRIIYELTDVEEVRAEKFMIEHEKKHGKDKSVSGGRYGWEVSPNGIGTGISILCHQCKTKEDISDYGSW